MINSVVQQDAFAGLHTGGSLQQRLSHAHEMFNRQCPGIARIGIALFDDSTGQVRTFLASQAEENPLQNYQAVLAGAGLLATAARPGQVRVINDLSLLERKASKHRQQIYQLGMRSSYTLPIHERERLCGFIFLDSRQKEYFQSAVLAQVGLFAHLLAQMVLGHQASIRSLIAALRVSTGMMHYRDPETGNHLERMARFSRLIAQQLVEQGKASLNDEQIDNLYRFAPLHDVGKVGIPDRILLKPGQLDAQEWAVMKTHSGIGRSIIDRLIDDFDFDYMPDIDLLRHIVELHHEKIDGSGYPHGLSGDAVPLAARIVSASDIFDALTNARPYKKAWSNADAFSELLQLAERHLLDADCVLALQQRIDEVVTIQEYFAEE